MELVVEGGGLYQNWMPLAARLAYLGKTGDWSSIGWSANKAGANWHHKGGVFTMNPSASAAKTTSIVVFLGGCTETELAAVRSMSTRDHQFLVVTTGMISARSFIQGFGMLYDGGK